MQGLDALLIVQARVILPSILFDSNQLDFLKPRGNPMKRGGKFGVIADDVCFLETRQPRQR